MLQRVTVGEGAANSVESAGGGTNPLCGNRIFTHLIRLPFDLLVERGNVQWEVELSMDFQFLTNY